MAEKKQKYYAVRQGRNPGIYLTWPECRENVTGFPGAVFKSFETMEEAESFLGDNAEAETRTESEAETSTESEAVAYVDGSFNSLTGEYAYGAVIFYQGREEHFSAKFDDPELAVMRNVAGEIEGAKRAMQYCIDNDISSIDIYYDYQGIMAWCTGLWKAGKEGTKAYKLFYDSVKDRVRVNFVKVKAHTGVTYNELADTLAKGALGL